MRRFLFHTLEMLLLAGILFPFNTMASDISARVDRGVASGVESRVDPGVEFGVEFGVDSRMDSGAETGVTARELENLHSRILYSIIALQFGEADSLIKVSLNMDPSHPETLYLQNYLEFLDALISGQRADFDIYLENSGQRIKIIKDVEKKYAGSLTCISSIHIQSSVLSAYHTENYRAARHFYHSYRFLRQSEQGDTMNERNFLNRGLITLGVGSVPDEYRWLLSILGMRGGINEGIGYLIEYHGFSKGARRMEACLILNTVVNTADPGKLEISMPLDCSNDSSTLYRYVKALNDLSAGNSQAVIENLGNYEQEKGERELLFLDLLHGEALLNSLDTAAMSPLKHFATKHTGIHYRHYAWNKLSWHYVLQGEWNLYRQAKEHVLGSGEAYLDADLQAVMEARDTMPLNVDLLRARVLYDGGYYSEALDQLEKPDSLNLLNQRDSLEYLYRIARIYDRQGEQSLAITSYEKVLESGAGETWYFAPNSALHLGLIYETEGNWEKSMKLYRQCLKINNSAYKKSIDYKARQGIRRIEELEKLR